MRGRAFMTLAMALTAVACSRTNTPPLPSIKTAAFLPAVRVEIDAAYQAARSHPEDANATGRLCRLLDAHDQPDAAAQCYKRASFLDPKSFEWHYNLGAVLMAQGRYSDAVAPLRTALTLRDYRAAALKLAHSLREAGNDDESLRTFGELVREEAGDAEAWYGLGRVQDRRHETTDAQQSYQRACDLYPNYGPAHYALALLLQRQGLAAAREHFNMAERHKTEVPPGHDTIRSEIYDLASGTTAMLRRAAAFEKVGRLDDAIRENLAALQKDQALLQAHVNLIALYGRSRQHQEAEQHYRAALDLPGGKTDADYNYGVLLESEDRLGEAEQAFRRALASNPRHAQAHHNLGYVLERQGRAEDALAQYEAAVASQTDYRLAHFHAGRLLAAARQYPAAISHLLKTIEPVDDSTPGYLYALSATYARAGQFRPALQFGERARGEAAVRQQTELLASIDRDLTVIRARVTRR